MTHRRRMMPWFATTTYQAVYMPDLLIALADLLIVAFAAWMWRDVGDAGMVDDDSTY